MASAKSATINSQKKSEKNWGYATNNDPKMYLFQYDIMRYFKWDNAFIILIKNKTEKHLCCVSQPYDVLISVHYFVTDAAMLQ